MFPGDLGQVDLEVEEAFPGALEEVFDVAGVVDELLELGDCVVDLVLVDLDEIDCLLPLADHQFGLLVDVLVERQPFLNGFLLDFLLDLDLDWLLRLHLDSFGLFLLFAHDC